MRRHIGFTVVFLIGGRKSADTAGAPRFRGTRRIAYFYFDRPDPVA
jgi:hypothetical protein